MVEYSKLLSYLLLTGTAFWALGQCDGDFVSEFWCCSNIGYGLICVNGFLGLWYCSRTRLQKYQTYMKSVTSRPSLFSTISFFTYVYSIPLIIIDLYLYYSFSCSLTYLHLIYPIAALFPRLLKKREDMQIVDMVFLIHCGSLTTTCSLKQNYYGLAAGMVLAFSHFFISSVRRILGLQSRVVQNYLMVFFVILTFKALVEAEKDWLLHMKQGLDCLTFC